jgi:hypothetical protein
MADTVFNTFKQYTLQGAYDLVNEPIRVVLLSAAPDVDTDIYYSDIASSEISAVGYTTSGIELSGNNVSADNTNDRAVFDANDISWFNSTITARYAALFQVMGNSSDSRLIGYIDFGEDKSSQNGEFAIQWNSGGILWIRPGT